MPLSSTVVPPALIEQTLLAGERVRKRSCGFYKLRGGKICEFRVFPFLAERPD